MVTVKDLKNFLSELPNDAFVHFGQNNITIVSHRGTKALNKWGAIWDDGIGYPPNGTSCCGECSHFQCDLCNVFAKGQ